MSVEAEKKALTQVDPKSLTERLQNLVRYPSVTGEETEAQHAMAEWLREIGLQVDEWMVEPGILRRDPRFPGARSLNSRQDVVGILEGMGGGRTLVLNGHMDVVTPGDRDRWTHDPWGGAVVDGRLYGRGACDMKGSLVAMVGAVWAIKRAGIALKGSVIVQSVIGEEDGGLGTFAALMRGYTGDAVIIGEPTGMRLAAAQAGVSAFRLHVKGRSTHASVRDSGVSAFEKFLPIYAGLVQLEKERAERLRHPLFADMPNPWCLNFGIVRTGTWNAIVPEQLTAEGRIGVAIGEQPLSAQREFEERVAAVAAHDPWLLENPPIVEWVGGVWESAFTPTDHPLPQTIYQALAETTGRTPKIEGVTFGSDMRLFTNAFGVPGVLFGPGDIRHAHAVDEHIDLEELETACKVHVRTILRFCGVE